MGLLDGLLLSGLSHFRQNPVKELRLRQGANRIPDFQSKGAVVGFQRFIAVNGIILADFNPASDVIAPQAAILGDLPGNKPILANEPVNHRANVQRPVADFPVADDDPALYGVAALDLTLQAGKESLDVGV